MSLDDIDGRDFDIDPTGSNSSADGLEALTEAVNAAQGVGYLPNGDYVCDRRITSLRRGGLVGPQAGVGIEGRATIVIPQWAGMPAGVGADDYWQTACNGAFYRNLAFDHPDQTQTGITGTYPALEGAPLSFPAVIKSEHHVDHDTGALLPEGSSIAGGRITCENLYMPGNYDWFRLRDDDPFDQKAVAGFVIRGIRGFPLRKAFVLGFVSGLSIIDDVIYSPAYWAPAGRAEDPDQRYFNWLRRNGGVLECANKNVGLRAVIAARGGRYGVLVRGGYRGAESPEEDYRGLQSGRMNGFDVTIGMEQVTTPLEFEDDGYANNGVYRFSGHPVDDADPTNSAAVCKIFDDRDIAGNLSKKGEDPDLPVSEENPRKFRLMNYRTGWRFQIALRSVESSGPALHIGPKDGHGVIELLAPVISRFSQGDVSLPAILIEAGARAKVIVRGGQIVASRGAGQIAFRVPAPLSDHIFFDGTQFMGCLLTDTEDDQAALFADRSVFSESCRWTQLGVDPDIDEDATGEDDDE